jgi:cytidine deaminase
LVHNISHSDLILALQEALPGQTAPSRETPSILARPQFNSFNPISNHILRQLDALDSAGIAPKVVTVTSKYTVQYPAGLDLTGEPSADLLLHPNTSNNSADDDGEHGPARRVLRTFRTAMREDARELEKADGELSERGSMLKGTAWSHFHIKGRKVTDSSLPKPLEPDVSSVRIACVYLPLLATVIPEWVRAIKRRALQRPAGTPAPRKVLVIVSGAGQPRDEKANPADNSTEGTGRIIERFVRLVHPEIEVVHIPSAYGIFRYDDNVRFVKEQVLPVLEAKRAEVVASHDDQWAQNLKVTVCLADGAPARISALHAAMRSYRPDYLHVWRTKTFWDTGMLSEDDVEPHTFKKLEMRPAVHRLQLTSAEEKGLVDEMVQYKRQFEAVRDSNTHELGTFWLRKTGKAVLAVLLTKSPLGELTFWRGMNVEVSMPTGTLCAERNAIGNALAGDHSVHRRDMLAVAVLSVTLSPPKHEVTDQALERTTSPDDEVALNPLDPCGACMEWLRKIAEVNPDFKVLTFTSTSCEKVFITPIGDYG